MSKKKKHLHLFLNVDKYSGTDHTPPPPQKNTEYFTFYTFPPKVKSSNKWSVLTTIVDVMKMHSSEEKGDLDMLCERYRDWRVRIPDPGSKNVLQTVGKSEFFFSQIVSFQADCLHYSNEICVSTVQT